ncbi:MAG: rhodanese-like domain-containing protein [Bacteroidia bacterium]|nr:rhodanese-like domain-containing protein [Bacteroidia bacterium]
MKKNIIMMFFTCATTYMAQINVSADEFEKKLKSDKNAVCIDLRTPEEIKKHGKIPLAIEIDWLSNDSEQKLSALDKSKNYYVYCAGGGRSAEAMEWMLKNGFKNVINLEKGFNEWKKKGKKVEELK